MLPMIRYVAFLVHSDVIKLTRSSRGSGLGGDILMEI